MHQIIAGDEGCRQWDVWAHAYADGSHMAWGGWLAQNSAWWKAHERHPEQVLWISFEEIKQDAEAAVRRVAAFLKLDPTEEAVRAPLLTMALPTVAPLYLPRRRCALLAAAVDYTHSPMAPLARCAPRRRLSTSRR